MTLNKKRNIRRKAYFLLPVFLLFLSVFSHPLNSDAAAATDGGTFYAALADISGSMPEDAFISGRSGIRELAHKIGASDSMSVITFGDAVTEIAYFNGGDPAAADSALAVLDSILPHDQTTKFYEALGFLQQRAGAAPQAIKRAVIMTDGVDVSDMTPETATALMSGFYDENIRIYGVLVESRQSTAETTAQFINFCEKTGGAVEIVQGSDAYSAFQSVISKMTSANVVAEEQERFQDAYQESGETVPIEQWTAGIPETPSSAASSEDASSEGSMSITTGTDGDKDGNGILDEYENGGAKTGTKPNALELIKPHLPLIIGIGVAVAAAVVLLLILSRRRPSTEGGIVTHGASKGKKVVTESAKEGDAPNEDDTPKKKEKEKREKNKDRVEFFFSEKKDE